MSSITMPSAIIREGQRLAVPSCYGYPPRGGLFNAASDWVGSCAITIKRQRDRSPRFIPGTPILRAAIGRSRKSRKPLCYPLPQLLRSGMSPCAVTGSSAVPIFWPYGVRQTQQPGLKAWWAFLKGRTSAFSKAEADYLGEALARFSGCTRSAMPSKTFCQVQRYPSMR